MLADELAAKKAPSSKVASGSHLLSAGLLQGDTFTLFQSGNTRQGTSPN